MFLQVLKEWRPFDSEGFSPLDLAIQESPRIKKKKGEHLFCCLFVLF